MKKQGQGVRLNLSAKLPDSETDQNKLSETNSPPFDYLESLVEINRNSIEKLRFYAVYKCVDRIAQLDYNIIVKKIYESIAQGDQKKYFD